MVVTNWTPLFLAANCGQVHTARRLLEGTADRRWVEVDRATTDYGATPLIQAAAQSFPGVTEILFQHCADANKARNDGVTPLCCAAQVGSVEVTQMLLVHGAEVNQANKKKQTPLHLAAYNGHVAIIHLLLSNQADANLRGPVLEVHRCLSLDGKVMTRWRRSWCRRSGVARVLAQ